MSLNFNDDTIIVNIGKNNHIQPLDPLTCIIKLAILSVKSNGTKISIHKNKIFFQDPTFYQGVLRWVFNDSKTDIHSLYYPIRRACEIFLTYQNKHTETDNYQTSVQTELTEIFQISKKGIIHLMNTYEEHPIITRCLSYYNRILSENKQPNIDNQEEEEEIYNNNTYLFKNLWTRNDIHLVYLLLTTLSTTQDPPSIIMALDGVLQPIEKRFYKYLASYSKNNQSF